MKRTFFEWILFLIEEYKDFLIDGTITTVKLAVVGTLLGFLLGFLIGIIQSAPIEPESSLIKKVFQYISKAICLVFVELFRGTPMMVQAMVVYYGALTFLSAINITPFFAGILVIGLNTAAYMAETVRGGILSIDKGQQEGAKALGMNHLTMMFSIILPQAFRNIIPEMGNLYITNLKMTSVLNVVGVSELYLVTKTAASTYYKFFEAFILTGMIYFVIVFITARLLRLLEKRLDGAGHYELAREYLDASEEKGDVYA